MKELLKQLYRTWMAFAHILGRINTTILLTVFYFSFLGVAKIIMVLSRKDLLDSKWKDRSNYWKRRQNFKIDRQAFLKPY